MEYKKHVGVVATADLDEHGQDEAKRWWVLDLLTISNGPSSGVLANKLFINQIPGRRGSGTPLTSPDRKWSANPDHPPKVWDERVVRTLVDWTPELGAIGAKASAGMRYLAALETYRAKHPKLGAELAELLAEGEQAIRNTRPDA
jgi:hypothetical protein